MCNRCEILACQWRTCCPPGTRRNPNPFALLGRFPSWILSDLYQLCIRAPRKEERAIFIMEVVKCG